MTLNINIPPEVESRLRNEAARLGMDEAEYAKQLIEKNLPLSTVGMDQATLELLDRWTKEDQTADPDEMSRRSLAFEDLKDSLNRNRLDSGGASAESYPVTRVIFLDSGPLGLVTQRKGVPGADACRTWLAGHLQRGISVLVPEIIDYELRRELLRSRKAESIVRLDSFVAANPSRYIPLTTAAMRLAAEFWADIRQRGLPTTDPRELDIDVIFAAQAFECTAIRRRIS